MNNTWNLSGRFLPRLAGTGLVSLIFSLSAYGAIPGDMNADQSVNSADIVYLVAYVFRGGPAPSPETVGDVDASCAITSGDIIFMVNYVFKSGPPPQIGCAVDPPSNVATSDYANANNGADVLVSFERAADEDRIAEYRVMMVKSGQAGAFDVDSANAVDSGNYTPVALTGEDIYTLLTTDARDTDGDPIAETVPYVTFVLSATAPDGGINTMSGPSAELTLENVGYVTTLAFADIATGGVEVDAEGYVYSADFGASSAQPGSTIVRIHPLSGVVDTFAIGFPLRGMTGNTIDDEGNFFQSNYRGGTVSKIDTAGIVSTYASTGISGPVGIAFDEFDTLYCSDCNAANIKKISPTGAVSIYASSALFNCPNGLDRDEAGNLFIANFGDGNVLKVTPGGIVSLFATLPGNNAGHAFYRDGGFWVTSRGGHQMWTLDTLGNATLLAGTGVRGHQDGPLASATFSLPNDCFLSNSGDRLYVNEAEPLTGFSSYPSRIRAIVFARP